MVASITFDLTYCASRGFTKEGNRYSIKVTDRSSKTAVALPVQRVNGQPISSFDETSFTVTCPDKKF
jgi:hypothetical protein